MLRNIDINIEEYKLAFSNTMAFLVDYYKKKIESASTEKEDVEYVIRGDFKKLKQAPYTDLTFLSPMVIKDLIKPNTDTDLSDYKEIIEYILINQHTSFQLKDGDREYYIRNFEKLLNIDQLIMKNNTANIKTLCDTSLSLYTEDITIMSPLISEQENVSDCNSAKRHLMICREIIDKINE
jgi:hypothetical protein